MQGWVVVGVTLTYLLLLFAVASHGDRRALRAKSNASRPLIYALSIAIFCTSWTFFGSVGQAAERGFEYLGIYIGPVLVFAFGKSVIRRIIRLSKSERITSIADFLAARYGKSFAVASVATIIATVGTIPYIALQLKAIAGSVGLMVDHYNPAAVEYNYFIGDISLLVALLLAIFAILFGTRHADATEHQDGLILAVALESVVKLTAFLAIGIAITFFVFGGVENLVAEIRQSEPALAALQHTTPLSTWLVLVLLSGFAILMLPRQFHVAIVENRGEDEVSTAGWLFPLYLVAINLFVLPIALSGIVTFGGGTNADLYVLALPMSLGWDALSLAAFIGGLSAATAMVIVASVALSIMISNDLVIPLFLRRFTSPSLGEAEDWSQVILNIRRTAIFLILICAFFYYREMANNTRLSSIGLLSFVAISQFAPPLIGGLLWRRANARGALAGMTAGFVVWAYTLLLPSLAGQESTIVSEGLFGFAALRPEELFGTQMEPLTHGVLWSLAINTVLYIAGSLSRYSTPLERVQASIFAPREVNPIPRLRRFRSAVTTDELRETISRYLGRERTDRSFAAHEKKEGIQLAGNDLADPATIRFSEQLLASAIGSSSARLVLSLLFKRGERTNIDAYRLLDDASEALQQNRDLLQIALDQMEQGISVLDSDYRLTCWNRQFRTLLELPDEMGQVGVSLAQVLDHLAERGEISRTEESAVVERISEFGAPWRFELTKSGRIIEVRSNPMPDGGIVATYADVTQRVEDELELERANENLEMRVVSRTAELTRVNAELAKAHLVAEEANLGKTRFLAAAGHDILQPLNAARLYCSSLMDRVEATPNRELAGNINSALDSVEDILGAVLDISRLDTGVMKPVENTFSLDGVFRQIETDFQPLAAEKGLKLRVVPCSIVVQTDRALFRRLVQNLVSNAIKYTPSGKVLLGVRRRGGIAEVQVFDTGIGIAPNEQKAIFREFRRLDRGAREATGLGLGLSIVDRIARVLKLKIEIRSNVDQGSLFALRIPVSSRAVAVVRETKRRTSPAAFDLSGISVLCIDNEPRILDGMRELLTGWGCRVALARSSSQAAALLQNEDIKPAVLMVDYHLDGENGIDAIEALREAADEQFAAVLVTADRSNEVKNTAAAIGVAVLNKPVKPAALRLALRQFKLVRQAAE